MKNCKKILVCGLGSIGSYYCRLIKKKWPNYRISILRSGSGLKKKEEDLADYIFYDKHKAIGWRPDFCIISSPATFHLKQALFFAENDIPILIEKPIGVPFQEEELWDKITSISKKIPIFVGYVLRQDPCAKLVKDYISTNLIGNLLEVDFNASSWLPDWRPQIEYKDSVSAKNDLGGGVLLELSHEIDLALWLFGKFEITYSFIRNSRILDIDVDDQAFLIGLNSEKTIFRLQLNFSSLFEKREVNIRGSKGEINWDLKEGIVSHKLKLGEQEKKIVPPNKDYIFEKQLSKFFNSGINNNYFLCNVEEAIEVLKIIEKSLNINKYHN